MKPATAWRAADNSCLSGTKMNTSRCDAVTDCRLSYGTGHASSCNHMVSFWRALPNKSVAVGQRARVCVNAWPVFSCLLFAKVKIYLSWVAVNRYHRDWCAPILFQYLTGTSAPFVFRYDLVITHFLHNSIRTSVEMRIHFDFRQTDILHFVVFLTQQTHFVCVGTTWQSSSKDKNP